jgi:protease IV
VPLESIESYMTEQTPGSIFSPFNRIAVIEIDGSIHEGRNMQDAFVGGKSTGSDEIELISELVRKDFTIKGVLVRVNSFGGSLLASDQIYTAISKLKASGKPVYTSMGSMATSGGYYVALSSSKIYANPTTLTGSIGVISMYSNQAEFNDWLGFDVETIKTGKYMDMMSSNKKMTKEEEHMLREFQQEKYQYFVDKVVSSRSITKEEAADVAQGQLFTGKQAKELKLVDELGSYHDAVEGLAKAAGISGKPELVYYRPQPQMTMGSMMPKTGFLERLLSF